MVPGSSLTQTHADPCRRIMPVAAFADAAVPELVDRSYARIRTDEMLAPVFSATLGDTDVAWAAHAARLTDFWTTIMQRSGRYRGDPFSAHLRLPGITDAMFDRWLSLFRTTCAEVLMPEDCKAFGDRAERIARSLRMGLFEPTPARDGPLPAETPAP